MDYYFAHLANLLAASGESTPELWLPDFDKHQRLDLVYKDQTIPQGISDEEIEKRLAATFAIWQRAGVPTNKAE